LEPVTALPPGNVLFSSAGARPSNIDIIYHVLKTINFTNKQIGTTLALSENEWYKVSPTSFKKGVEK